MPGRKKEGEKKTCQYYKYGLKCDRPLFDEKHCIFHSKDKEGKKDTFMDAFWQEYESQKREKDFIFIEFVFPPCAKLQKTNLFEANLQRADLRKADLMKAFLKGAELPWANLEGVNLEGANLEGANLQGIDLRWADLRGADLQTAFTIVADLRGANLQEAELSRANFEDANLKKAKLQGARLCGTHLDRAFLKEADLREADLREADLCKADLRRGNLERAKLENADLQGTNIKRADLSYSTFEKTNVKGIKFNSLTRCLGIDASQAHGSPRFVRFVKDQEFLEDYRMSHPIIYYLWYIFADCGRSFLRWALWSVLFAVFFAVVFFKMGPEAFTIQGELPYSFITMLYYSVVTFTTLGFGDIIPNTTTASLFVMWEVIMGYIMLGGLISILANKLARRS